MAAPAGRGFTPASTMRHAEPGGGRRACAEGVAGGRGREHLPRHARRDTPTRRARRPDGRPRRAPASRSRRRPGPARPPGRPRGRARRATRAGSAAGRRVMRWPRRRPARRAQVRRRRARCASPSGHASANTTSASGIRCDQPARCRPGSGGRSSGQPTHSQPSVGHAVRQPDQRGQVGGLEQRHPAQPEALGAGGSHRFWIAAAQLHMSASGNVARPSTPAAARPPVAAHDDAERRLTDALRAAGRAGGGRRPGPSARPGAAVRGRRAGRHARAGPRRARR